MHSMCQRTLYQPRNTLPAYKTGMGWSSKRNDSDTVRAIESVVGGEQPPNQPILRGRQEKPA